MSDHPTTEADRQPTGSASDHPTGRIGRAWAALTSSPDQTTPTGNGRPVTVAVPTSAPKPTRADRLRFIPPVAALGTAFVMQVVAVTDTVGEAIVTALQGSEIQWLAGHVEVGYLFALLLGIAVASCAEGGAAYLMDLYDKHLLARDSTWMLRLAMFVYVGGSGAAIHWWTAHRHLPAVTSWLLAGMSGSALFLWSRGSRWRNRKAMREAGQLDPAMPKLPMAAKVWHPVRWLVTSYLVSWEPAATTDEARARYEGWRTARADRKAARKSDRHVAKTDRQASDREQTDPTGHGDRDEPASRPADRDESTRQTPQRPTGRQTTKESTQPNPTGRPTIHLVHGRTAIADAAFLREKYGDDQSADHFPGRNELMRRHDGNAGKWSAALKAHADRADRQPTGGSDQHSDDSEERVS